MRSSAGARDGLREWEQPEIVTWGPGVKAHQDNKGLSGKTEKQAETADHESGEMLLQTTSPFSPPHPPIQMLKP